jgi:hypothetical protein
VAGGGGGGKIHWQGVRGRRLEDFGKELKSFPNYPCAESLCVDAPERLILSFVKAFIIFVLVLIILLASGIGWFGYQRLNRIEPRGVGLVVEKEFVEADIERLTTRYNAILDREEVLMPTVKKHHLKDYYGVGSNQEAVEEFREDTYIKLPGGKALHVMFDGKRRHRSIRDAASSDLAKDFVEAAQMVGQ